MKIYDKTVTLFHCNYDANTATSTKIQPVYYEKIIKTAPSEKGLQYSNQFNLIIPAFAVKPTVLEISQNDKIVVGDVDFVVDGTKGHGISDLMEYFAENCFNIISKEVFCFDEAKTQINHVEIVGV